LDKIKFNFALDQQTGLPLGFTPGMQTEANYLVEEFMLLANQSVAEKILNAFPEQAFLRRHPSPDDKQIRDMRMFCSNYGIDFDSSSAATIQKFMLDMKEKDSMIHQVLSLLLLKSMQQAVYFPAGSIDSKADMAHYALNIPVYTHFTSPIRRYPDIIVHRMLDACLNRQEIYLSIDDLNTMSDHCNGRKTASRLVSEASQKLFLCLFIKETKPLETAVVTGVLDRAFDVLIIKYGMVARIYLDQHPLISKPRFENNSGRKTLSFFYGTGKSAQHFTIAVSKTIKVIVDVMENELTRLKVRFLVFLDFSLTNVRILSFANR
jgi:DIS3-like exonuclease 2